MVPQCYPSFPMAPASISSRQNAIVARFRRAARGDDEALLLDGAHLISEALDAGVAIRDVLVTSDALRRPEIALLADRLRDAHVSLITATSSVVAAASPVRSPSGVVGLADRIAQAPQLYAAPVACVLIACDVQDPGNVGAMVRVAEAAGATGFVAAGDSADPLGWKALRGSMGSALRLPMHRDQSITHAAELARIAKCRLIVTTPRGGRSPDAADLRGRVAVLIGGEGHGIPDEIVDAADDRITIPMQAPVESLNAAVTAAIVLYEARRQRSSS
jgi:TrmH family RNA methyltransferase